MQKEKSKITLGETTTITFTQFNKQVEAKVDTGATMSSIHAEDVNINKELGYVEFSNELLSEGIIRLDLVEITTIVSADGGDNDRPVVSMDIKIEGISLPDTTFNLNDRDGMDSPILVGQNVLEQGNFVVDVNQGSKEAAIQEQQDETTVEEPEEKEEADKEEISNDKTDVVSVAIPTSVKETREFFERLTKEDSKLTWKEAFSDISNLLILINADTPINDLITTGSNPQE